MSRQDFEKQFTRLIITARDIPRKTAPYHVLLVSAILGFDPARDYSEADVNAELQRWILEFGRKLKVEHVELRRFLVDAGYLARDTSGSAYRVMPDAGPIALDPDLKDIDLVALLASAREAREARKRAHEGRVAEEQS